ncbi:MAG TPA: hypothetical protein VIK12_04060 [Pengzhenrongella sp.]
MSTIVESNILERVARTEGFAAGVAARTEPAALVPDPAWLTATIRPAGSFGRDDTSRLRALLDALSACASIVVLDLQAARLRGSRAAEVIEDAAWDIERRGGCLMCINVDAESRTWLSAAGSHAVLMDDPPHPVARG